MAEKHLELNHHEEGDSKSPLQSVQKMPKERLLEMYRLARSRLKPVIDQFLDHIERKKPNNYTEIKESLNALDNSVETYLENQKADLQFEEELEKICARVTKELTNFRKNNLVAKPYWDAFFTEINAIRDECWKILDTEFHLPSFNESQELQKENGHAEFHRNAILRGIRAFIESYIYRIKKNFHASDSSKTSSSVVYLSKDRFSDALKFLEGLIAIFEDYFEKFISEEVIRDKNELIKLFKNDREKRKISCDIDLLLRNKLLLEQSSSNLEPIFFPSLQFSVIINALQENNRDNLNQEVREWSLKDTLIRILFPGQEIVFGQREKNLIRDYILDLSQDPNELEQYFSDEESCKEIIVRINDDLYGGNVIVDFEMIHPAIISIIRNFNEQRCEAETVQIKRPVLSTEEVNIMQTRSNQKPINNIKGGEFSISITPNNMKTNGIDFSMNTAGAVDEGPDEMTLDDADSDLVQPESEQQSEVDEDFALAEAFSYDGINAVPVLQASQKKEIQPKTPQEVELSEKQEHIHPIAQRVEEVLKELDIKYVCDANLEIRLEQFAIELDRDKQEYTVKENDVLKIKQDYDDCASQISKFSVDGDCGLIEKLIGLRNKYVNNSTELSELKKDIEKLEGAMELIRTKITHVQELNRKRSVIKANLIKKIEEVLQEALFEAGTV